VSQHKTRYKPTDPELFKVTLFPVENCEGEKLRKSFVEDTFIRIVLDGLKKDIKQGKKHDSD